jgi:hypothetical protein
MKAHLGAPELYLGQPLAWNYLRPQYASGDKPKEIDEAGATLIPSSHRNPNLFRIHFGQSLESLDLDINLEQLSLNDKDRRWYEYQVFSFSSFYRILFHHPISRNRPISRTAPYLIWTLAMHFLW